MTDAEFKIQQFIFLRIAYFADFFASEASFYTQIKFSIKNSSIYTRLK